jgi:hypothetical protein
MDQARTDIRRGGDGTTRATRATGGDDRPAAAAAVRLTTEQVWRHLAKASFAIISQVTPAGEPRSSGVMCKSVGRRLYVVVAPDSWKARHIEANPNVALTVPVRRGGVLSLVAPIPPATISFHGTAVVHPSGSTDIPQELASLIPPERRTSSRVVEITPEGSFVTYGLGVSLMRMQTPALSRARVPVTPER